MDVLVEWLSGWTGMVSIALNEFFSWNICGINVGALVVIVFIAMLMIWILWG